MPTRGRGMSKTYRLNDHNALCDRCQKKFFASDLRKEWTGWYVCQSCFEPRHPQDFLKGHRDDPQVAWTRPDSNAITNVTTVDGESLVTVNDPIAYHDDVGSTLVKVNTTNVWNTPLTADRIISGTHIAEWNIGDIQFIYRTAGGVGTLTFQDDFGIKKVIPANVNAAITARYSLITGIEQWEVVDYFTLGL